MAQTIKLKRSAVAGRIPTTSDLDLGEVAINTYDGKMYMKKNVSGVESIVEVTSAQIPADPTFDSVTLTGAPGPIEWNSDEDTVDIPLNSDVTLQVGQETVFRGKAIEAIANGDAVMFAGAQGDHLLIAKADMSAVGFEPEHVIGIATQDFALNEFGFVTTFGKVRGLNTAALSEGDILYVDPSVAGGLTTTRPNPPDHIIQMCAVTKSHLTQGTFLVRPTHFHDTDEVPEGLTNLYFTYERAVAAVAVADNYVLNTGDTINGDLNVVGDLYITASGDNGWRFRPGVNSGFQYGFADQHGNAQVFTNEQGTTNQAFILGDTNPNSSNTLFGVSVISGGNNPTTGDEAWTKKLNLTGAGDLYIGPSGTSEVWHEGNFNPNNYLLTSNYVDDYVTSASFNTTNGVLTLTRAEGGTVTVDLDGRYLQTETDNQTLSWNGASGELSISGGNTVDLDGRYLQSYTETDTLDSVTTRGNTTTNNISVGEITANSLVNFVSPDTASTITASMLDGGTLSFSGTSGQLFSISDSMSGTIFSVNDISGIPSIEVDDDGTIRLAEFSGNVLLGTNVDNGTDSLQVAGSISATEFNGSLDWDNVTNKPTIDNSVDYINAASFNTGTGVLTLSGPGRAGAVVDLDGRYLTSYTDTNTTYAINAQDVSGGKAIRLTGSDGSTDDVTFAAGSNVTLTRSGDTITIASTDTNTDTNTTDWYVANSAGTNQFKVDKNEKVRFEGSGATSVSFDAATNKVTINSTDTNTNTWRPIHDTPVDGATTTSISSNWAFDNVKTPVPANAVFTDTETTTTLTKVGNELRYVNEAGTTQAIDLSLYLDDTNLARIVNGTMNSSGIATFTRDDSTTFTVDMSVLLDDTNLARITSASWNTSNGVLTLTRNDSSTINVDLDNRYLQSYTETDTLATVTARGATTNTNITVGGTLRIGNSASSSENKIAFSGTVGENPGSYYNTIIGEYHYAESEDSELILYKGNDAASSSGPDRIRSIAANHVFDVYNAPPGYSTSLATIASWPMTRAMTITSDGNLYQGSSNRIFHDAYHPNADKWTNVRTNTVTLTGDASGSGSASVDGTGNWTVSVPVTVANDSHNHDGRYYTESEIQTFMNRGFISSHSASNLPVGWYTIATNTGDRASGRFGIWDTYSGDHQSVTFYAAHHFGTDSSNTLTVLDNSYHSGNPFRHIRIKDAGTYDGAALQIYIDDASNSVNCAILGDNFQASSWVLCDWIPDATTPPNVDNYAGFGERSRVDLNQIAQGGFATTGEIYAGGDTTLHRVWHDGYHPVTWNDISGKPTIDNSVDYINAASFNTGTGVLTLSGVGRAGATVDLDNRYLTSYTETDTLQSVTTRGNTTSQDINISNAQPKLRLKETDSTNVDKELLVSGGNFYIRRGLDDNTPSSNLFIAYDSGNCEVVQGNFKVTTPNSSTPALTLRENGQQLHYVYVDNSYQYSTIGSSNPVWAWKQNGTSSNIMSLSYSKLTLADGTYLNAGFSSPDSHAIAKTGDIQLRIGDINTVHNPYIRWQGNSGSGAYYGDIQLEASGARMVFRDPGASSSSIGTNPTYFNGDGSWEFGTKVTVNEHYTIEVSSAASAATTEVAIATFPKAEFSTGKLVIQAKNTVSGEIHASELLIIHDGTTATATEYAMIYSGSAPLATYDVDISGANVRVLATPASANNTTFKTTKNLIKV